MEQQQLFMVEDVFEAMRAAARAIAAFHRPKEIKSWSKIVGTMLWTTKNPEDAGKYLSNCLDKSRQEKLCVEEYLWLKKEAKRVGCHILHAYDCEFTEYQISNPIEPKDEVADLQTQYISAAREMKRLAERIEDKMGSK